MSTTDPTPLRVLIVGAGAVGQAYGYHMQKGGAEVAFFVREKYRADLASGVVVYPLNRRAAWDPVVFSGFELHSDWSTVAASRWDQVWLAIPSTALRQGWLGAMVTAIGDAFVVALQPGLDDRDVLLQHLPAARLVQGVITLQSFHAPLPGAESVTPGMAWWFPPLSPIPLGGDADTVRSVAAALERGGCPANPQPGKQVSAVAASAVMMPIIAALETAGWSLKRLRTTNALTLGCDVARECSAVVAGAQGKKAPWFTTFVRPWLLSLIVRVAPYVIPFDLERFFEVHFTKVGAQTRLMFATYARRGRELGVSTTRLLTLQSALGPTEVAAATPQQAGGDPAGGASVQAG